MYLTYVIGGNMHCNHRAGYACQVRRGYVCVSPLLWTNYGLRAPHVTQEPDYQVALAAI